MHIPYKIHFSLIDLVKLFSFYYALSISYNVVCQETSLYQDNFTEITSDEEKFSMYLDTIRKYRYRDIDIASQVTNECERMINDGVLISDSLLLSFAISNIYLKYIRIDALGAYKIVLDNEYLIESENQSIINIGNFLYLKSYTLLTMGDLEAAQEAFYKGIESGKEKRDTFSVIQSLYSLGQLYHTSEAYDEAVECYEEIIEYGESIELETPTHALTYVELGKTYIAVKDYNKALESLEYAYELMDSFKIEVYKSEALVYIGDVYLAQDNVPEAEKIYIRLKEAKKGSLDNNNVDKSRRFLAKIYRAKKMYPKALNTYREIIAEMDTSRLEDVISTYSEASNLCFEMRDFELAHKYLLLYNKAKEKEDKDAKRQKTAYLKIRYNSEQKENENAILAAQIHKNQAERKTLYSWLGLSTLLLGFLMWAFYQKGRYSHKLEGEVSKRTEKLRESNELLNSSIEELDEFNRILSHDLKEPLRGIVSFSQLASRDLKDEKKVQEYLAHVSKSGEQLDQLIDDVSVYRSIDSLKTYRKKEIKIKELFSDIVLEIQPQFSDKKINLVCDNSDTISCSLDIVKKVFYCIVHNAVKFNSNNTVIIIVNYFLKDQLHTFEIKDNGIGIPAAYHDQVFMMFKRLNNRENYPGSGLGLSIAHKLVTKIGGDISILRSEENKGTTFKVTFEA